MGDSLHSFIAGGMDTARVRADEADQERRRQNQRDARGNLAAMVVGRHGGLDALRGDPERLGKAGEEFAGLLELLGLNVLPEHQPGRCRSCASPLPMIAASSFSGARSPHWRAGYCSAQCWAEVL